MTGENSLDINPILVFRGFRIRGRRLAAAAPRLRPRFGRGRILRSGSLEDVYVNTLGKLIDRELAKSLPEIVQNYVYAEAGAFLGSPLSVTMQKHGQELPKLKSTLMGLIHAAILGALPQLLGSGEIRRLVVKRINSLEPRELNALLKDLMKKELHAIEWLGALLGGILGAVTYFAGRVF